MMSEESSNSKMAAQTPGIQQLLQAEKRAADRVAAARKRKARRLKEAKEEAQAEIESYRKEREASYQAIQQKHLGSKGDQAREIEVQTAAKIQELNQRVSQARGQVLEDLFNNVFDIKPELHQNLQL